MSFISLVSSFIVTPHWVDLRGDTIGQVDGRFRIEFMGYYDRTRSRIIYRDGVYEKYHPDMHHYHNRSDSWARSIAETFDLSVGDPLDFLLMKHGLTDAEYICSWILKLDDSAFGASYWRVLKYNVNSSYAEYFYQWGLRTPRARLIASNYKATQELI